MDCMGYDNVWHSQRKSLNKMKIYFLRLIIVTGVLFFLGLIFVGMRNLKNKNVYSLQIYKSKGSAKSIDFPQFQFQYPNSWTVTEDTGNEERSTIQDLITLSKGNYTITIRQELISGPSLCQFSDSPIVHIPSVDLSNVAYTEIIGVLGKIRYAKIPESKNDNALHFIVCFEDKNKFELSTIGTTEFVIPRSYDLPTYIEMIDIIKSIKPVSSDPNT
jgi:hypothetical protein